MRKITVRVEIMTEEELWQCFVDNMTEQERIETLKSIDEKMNNLTKSYAQLIELERIYKKLLLKEISGKEFCERRRIIIEEKSG